MMLYFSVTGNGKYISEQIANIRLTYIYKCDVHHGKR